MYKEENFDDKTPSVENIDIVFSKILFCLTSANEYSEYILLRDKINIELKKFNKLLNSYTNTKNLLSIDFSELNELAINIAKLDYESLNKNGMYLEMANVWISILLGYYGIIEKEKEYGKR